MRERLKAGLESKILRLEIMLRDPYMSLEKYVQIKRAIDREKLQLADLKLSVRK